MIKFYNWDKVNKIRLDNICLFVKYMFCIVLNDLCM